MADSVIGALSVKITADAQGVEDGVKAAGNALAIGGKQLRNSANQFGKWALAGATAAATIGTAIVKMNLTAVRELKNVAFAANTTVKEFQQGAFAAEQFGISTEKYGDILKDTTERVGDFLTEGAGPMTRFFEQVAPKIGITADAFRGLSGQQALGLYVKSLQDANLSQQEMTVFMEDIASDSTRLIPLFRDNAKQLKAMSAEAEALGVGLSALEVAQAELANKELAKSAAFIDATTKRASIGLAPVLVGISNLFTDIANKAGGMSNIIDDAISGAITVVGVFADGLHGINIIIKGIELGFSAAAVVISKVFEIIAAVGVKITQGVLIPIKGLIDLAALIPGSIGDGFESASKSVSEFSSGLNADLAVMGEFTQAQIENTKALASELNALALQELPSEQIKKFVDDAKSEFDSLSKTDIEDILGTGAGEGNGEGNTVAGFNEAERIRLENEEILNALLEQGQMREETLLGRLERERAILDEARMLNQISEESFAAASVALTERTESTKLGIISSTLDAVAQAISVGGKKAGKVQEKIAIFSALIKGKEAAVSAWAAGMSTGGPFAPVVAASYAAASLAKTAGLIKSIRSRSSGSSGGGSVSPSRSAGSSGSGSASSNEQSAVQSQRKVSIQMVGGSGLFSADQVRELIGQINDQVGDGVSLITE